MARCGASVPQSFQNISRQFQQAEFVGYGGLTFPNAPGRLLLREMISGDQLFQSQGLFPEVQILPLYIFYQGQQGGALVVDLEG